MITHKYGYTCVTGPPSPMQISKYQNPCTQWKSGGLSHLSGVVRETTREMHRESDLDHFKVLEVSAETHRHLVHTIFLAELRRITAHSSGLERPGKFQEKQ